MSLRGFNLVKSSSDKCAKGGEYQSIGNLKKKASNTGGGCLNVTKALAELGVVCWDVCVRGSVLYLQVRLCSCCMFHGTRLSRVGLGHQQSSPSSSASHCPELGSGSFSPVAEWHFLHHLSSVHVRSQVLDVFGCWLPKILSCSLHSSSIPALTYREFIILCASQVYSKNICIVLKSCERVAVF